MTKFPQRPAAAGGSADGMRSRVTYIRRVAAVRLQGASLFPQRRGPAGPMQRVRPDCGAPDWRATARQPLKLKRYKSDVGGLRPFQGGLLQRGSTVGVGGRMGPR